MQNAAVFRQPLIAVADSLSFRVADLNERGPRYKWRHLIELLRRTQGSSASPGAPTKSTQASAPSSISPPHPSIRDESQQALGEKALCADLRPHTARSINDRYLRKRDARIRPQSTSSRLLEQKKRWANPLMT